MSVAQILENDVTKAGYKNVLASKLGLIAGDGIKITGNGGTATIEAGDDAKGTIATFDQYAQTALALSNDTLVSFTHNYDAGASLYVEVNGMWSMGYVTGGQTCTDAILVTLSFAIEDTTAAVTVPGDVAYVHLTIPVNPDSSWDTSFACAFTISSASFAKGDSMNLVGTTTIRTANLNPLFLLAAGANFQQTYTTVKITQIL